MMLVLERLATYTAGELSAACIVSEHVSLKAVYVDKSLAAYLANLAKIELEYVLLFAPAKRAVVAF